MQPMDRRSPDLWYTEYQKPDMRLGLRIKEILINKQTQYQHILVVETAEYGRLLALDGAIQLTEKDEFTYHEMITHVAMCAHPAPKRVLVVGGGDGGVVREVIKHDSVERVTLVDIDEAVIETSRAYFPSVSCALDHPKVEIATMDALVYVKEHVDEFNVIVVDSTDPVDFAAGLYERSFFVTAASALKGDGMIVAQTESPFAEPEIVSSTFSALREVFPISFLYWGAVPTYPTGLWTYAIGSKLYDPRDTRSPAPLDVRYYTKELHRSAFILPKFLKDLIGGDAQVQTKQKACRAT